MRRLITTALLLTIPMIQGCSGSSSEDNKVTQTRMADIDSLEGTISDDMINTDESTETAPLDAALAPVIKEATKVEKKPEKADIPSDAVIIPSTKAGE